MRENDDIRMNRIARSLRGPVPVSSSVDDRVMAAVRRLPRHSRFGLWARLTTPRTVTITPLRWGLLAASVMSFAAIGVAREYELLGSAARPIASAFFHNRVQPARAQRVQFVLVAPGAKKVAVAGDFNGWDPTHAAYQAKQRGGGVWSVTAPVPPGHHRYSFVVDDSVWVADPTAPRAADNDYGMPNSAIVVEDDK